MAKLVPKILEIKRISFSQAFKVPESVFRYTVSKPILVVELQLPDPQTIAMVIIQMEFSIASHQWAKFEDIGIGSHRALIHTRVISVTCGNHLPDEILTE